MIGIDQLEQLIPSWVTFETKESKPTMRHAGGTRWRARVLVFSALVFTISGLISPESSRAQKPAAPKRTRNYQAFLWMKGGPALGRPLFASLKGLGLTGTNVAGTAPSDAHGAHSIPFYVDHAAGKGPLFLAEDAWQGSLRRFIDDRDPTALIRPRCLSDPGVLEAAEKRMAEVVAGAAPHHPFAYSLDDEISLTRRNCPFDFCRGPLTLVEFRRFLARKYGTANKLSRTWGRRVSDFATAIPDDTNSVRRRELVKDPMLWNFASWSDHREFMDELFTGVVGRLATRLRRLDPGVPVGFSGGEAPSPFSGINWFRILREVDFVEPYDIGGSRELVRSFASPETTVLRTLFRPKGDFRSSLHELWDYRLRGDDGVILWCANDYFPHDDPARPSPWARALAPTLKAVASPNVEGFSRAPAPRPEIAILESPASNRLHWMLDSRFDGRRWLNRSSSWEHEHSSQNRVRETWQKLLEDLHFDYRHLAPQQLNRRDLEGFKVLILPRAIALSDDAIEAIRAFGRRNTVIADCQLGLFDGDLRVREEPPLDEFFGISRRNRRVHVREARYTGPKDPRHPDLALAEPGLRVRQGVPTMATVAGAPILIVRGHPGGGRTAYLNLLLTRYLKERVGRVDHELRSEVRGLLRLADVRSAAELVIKDGPAIPVRLHHRRDGKRDYIALMANWRTSTVKTDADAVLESAPQRIRILLARAGYVTDVLTGQRIGGKESATQRISSFECLLSAHEARLFRIDS